MNAADFGVGGEQCRCRSFQRDSVMRHAGEQPIGGDVSPRLVDRDVDTPDVERAE